MVDNRYSEHFDIPCYMFDCGERLRPSSFFDIAQELAAKGSQQLGVSDQDLAPLSLVWVLVRMTVRFDALPHRLDSVIAQTWHRGMEGLTFVRDYCLLGSDGSPCVQGSSRWVLMDTGTRTLVHGPRLAPVAQLTPQDAVPAIPDPCAKTVLPSEAVEFKMRVCEHRVVYSDLDYNGHVNNAKYIVWALDSLPLEMMKARPVREISISYLREALPGQTVSLFHFHSGGDVFVEGRSGLGQVFVAKICF